MDSAIKVWHFGSDFLQQRMNTKEDGRRLSREAQYERRKQAVRLHRQDMKATEIASALSMSHVTVYAAIKAAQKGGLRALAPKPTGCQVGQRPLLKFEWARCRFSRIDPMGSRAGEA